MIKVSVIPVQLPLLLAGELLMQSFKPIKALRPYSLPKPLGFFSEPLIMPLLLLPECLIHLIVHVPVKASPGPHQPKREAIL